MLTPTSGSADERRLTKMYRALSAADREMLLAFADFLCQRAAAPQAQAPSLREPQHAPRPEKESVVAAIKRLSKTYDMLERDALLNDTSALMSAHVLQGRAAQEVIDELEALFARHYSDYRSKIDPEG